MTEDNNVMAENNTMRILLIRPGKRPEVKVIPHTLEEMQKTVGGCIQATYPWDDLIGLICDEDALTKPEQQGNRKINDDMAIKGPFFLCGLGEEDFTDFPKELIDKYMKLFWKPEIFVRTVRGPVIIPVDREWDTEGEMIAALERRRG